VTGWNGTTLAPEREIKQRVEKLRMLEVIDRIVLLIDHCKATGLKMCVFGD
jgi:hypothetical protein